MKKTSLTSSAIRNATVISDGNSPLEIRHQLPDVFVFIDKEMNRPIHCFQSVNMSRLLSDQKCSISNATFSERTVSMGEPVEPFHELFIELVNGKRFTLSSSGRIHEMTAFRSSFPAAALAYAPQSIWQIPNWEIPQRMLLTGRLIDEINILSQEGAQIEIINLLYAEYSKMYRGSNSTEIQVEIDRHQLNCLVLDFERIRLFDSV